MNLAGALFAAVVIGGVGYMIYTSPPPPPNTTVNVQSDNPSVKIQKLFTQDGCTGYKAYGGSIGDTMYYVVCDGGRTTNTNWNTTQLVGKIIVTKHHNIPVAMK